MYAPGLCMSLSLYKDKKAFIPPHGWNRSSVPIMDMTDYKLV